MRSTVLTKTLLDQARLLVAWAAALALLIGMYVALWPSIRDQPAMNAFLEQMPDAFRSLFAATGADMSTPVGYLKVELLSFMGPIAILLYSIGTGVAAIAGEEERHTLETLLAEPVSRARVVVEKAGALVVGTAFLSAVTGAAAVAEGQLADMDLPAGNIAAAMVHLGLLGLVFGAFALALSAATGKAGASRGLPAAVAVVAYVLNGLGGVIDWLKPFQKLSPFYQYSGHDPLANGVDWPSVGISAGTVVVLVALAVLGFRRRDTEA